jgi:predicted nucleic acid-binding protein
MRLYLETTVPNFLFADDAPDKRHATEAFFTWLRVSSDDLFISKLVEAEIAVCSEPKRTQLIGALAALTVTVLPIPNEAGELAQEYLRAAVVPSRYRNDALHVAIAVWHKMDIIVSWNMRHLVNVRKVDQINAVNRRLGFPAIRIHTPEEVLET